MNCLRQRHGTLAPSSHCLLLVFNGCGSIDIGQKSDYPEIFSMGALPAIHQHGQGSCGWPAHHFSRRRRALEGEGMQPILPIRGSRSERLPVFNCSLIPWFRTVHGRAPTCAVPARIGNRCSSRAPSARRLTREGKRPETPRGNHSGRRDGHIPREAHP